MNIRKAISSDKEQLLLLLKQFHQESLDEYGLGCEDLIAKQIIPRLLEHTLVVETDNMIVGVICGILTTYPLNREVVCQELVWYMNRGYRSWGVRLLREFEKYLKGIGVKRMVMTHMANSKPDKLERFYKRLGYKMLEIHYVKEI